MTTVLRGYQTKLQQDVIQGWNAGHRVVMPVCATGSGKTKIMASTARLLNHGHGLAAAHRNELVGQISMALAGEGLAHDIIAQPPVIRMIVEQQLDELGKSYYNARSRWHVAGVDTLIRRDVSSWSNQVAMGFMDEGHHVLADNKWGRAVSLFSNAKWMLPTATPCRADGKGLGLHACGLVELMVLGPPMRMLIDQGYLTDYVVRAPMPSDLDLSDVDVTNGEYNQEQLRAKVKRSNKIVGDVVDTYCKFTPGKLGIVFAVDIEHATTIAREFNQRDVAAAVIHSGHTTDERRKMLKAFKRGELRVLVNVDLFGEGFDLPAVEVVMFARPTMSFSLYAQQWGRALRLMIGDLLMRTWDDYPDWQRRKFISESAKPVAFIHDHVGNMLHFRGPPDRRTQWSLDNAERKRSSAGDGIPMRTCVNEMCLQPYERTYPACPYCGKEPPAPVKPSGPEEVDGDITLYTPEMISAMFGEIKHVLGDAPANPHDHGVVANSIRANHHARKQASQQLGALLQFRMGAPNLDQRKFVREFFYKFGVDTLKAQALPAKEILAIRQKMLDELSETTVPSVSLPKIEVSR